MKTFSDRIQYLCGYLAGTLEKKNNDYGDSYKKSIDKHGESVLLIRLEDKLNRLEKLLKTNNQEVKSESIEDTLLDIAGYSILEIERRNRESNQ